MGYITLNKNDKILSWDYGVTWDDDTRPLYHWVGMTAGRVFKDYRPLLLEARRPFYMPYWGFKPLTADDDTLEGDVFEAPDGRLFFASMLVGCKIARLNERTHLKVWRPEPHAVSPFQTLTDQRFRTHRWT